MKYDNRPWEQVLTYVKAKYNIVGTVDLLEVDQNPDAMFAAFKSLAKDFYDSNDRILIYHYDTDFYQENSNLGFIIYNALRCITTLDIPISFCLFLTSHYGLKKEIEDFMKSYSTSPGTVNVFESNYQQFQSSPDAQNTTIDSNLIDSHYNCMIGARRVHREMLLCGLREKNLLDRGVLSWHFNEPPTTTQPTYSQPTNKPKHKITFLTTYPWSRINETWYGNDNLKEFYQKNYQHFKKPYANSRIEGTPNSASHRFIIPVIKTSFLYVSAETVYNYPHPYLTEKTFRSFLHKRPLVILGAPNSIAQLQKLGFKTFSNFWSEEYDSITDPSLRLEKVLDIIEWICSKSINELREMCNNMEEILDYNLSYYQSHYAKKNLIKQLRSI